MKGIMQFGMKGKLSPRYVGPYEITRRVSKEAYDLYFPKEIPAIYNVFRMSLLRKYIMNPDHVLTLQAVQVQGILSYKEKLVEILDRTVKKLRNKERPLVKDLSRKP